MDPLTAIEPLPAAEAEQAHLQRISRALELIARGEIYEVNLARKLRFRVRGRAFELLERLSRPRLARYAAALDWPEASVIAASPELCLATRPGGDVWTSPIKGTRPRDDDPLRHGFDGRKRIARRRLPRGKEPGPRVTGR